MILLARWFENTCAVSLTRLLLLFCCCKQPRLQRHGFKSLSPSPFSRQEVAESSELEPALESLLRLLKIHESVITAMRVKEILDCSVFSDSVKRDGEAPWCLAESEDSKRSEDHCTSKPSMAQISVKKLFQLRATSKSSKNDLQKKPRSRTSERSCVQEEAEAQRKNKPDPACQYGMHLDGRLTLQTRRRFSISEPRDIEQLRANFSVMENMWLLAQLRQPGRAIFGDLTAKHSPIS